MDDVAKEMQHLNELAKREPGKHFNRLWKNLTSVDWLAQVWEQIRGNRGSQTAGVDNTTAVDVDLTLIEKLARRLKAGTYRPKPVRRVHIPKANGKTRPLGIPTVEDRIVQQALRMLLEPIFEADFHNCSHGFRQGRSTHTALRDVARAYPNIAWVIEGDIDGCFDNIPHGRLIGRLRRRIADEKVLQLIWRFLDAGYMEGWKYHKTYSGTPQGGVLSPLLANAFLHQLDEYMVDELKANRIQTKRESISRRNPEYKRLENKLGRLRRKLRDGEGDRETVKKIEEVEKERRHIPCYARDKRHPCKVKYVRYADDFIILVAGNKEETKAIRDGVKQRLSDMGLSLSEEKTRITHWSRNVLFLGYQIQGKQRARGVGLRAVLSIPREKVRKVEDAAKEVSGYYHIPEVDVMVQLSAIYRGWCNYYRYANQPQPVFSKLENYVWWKYAHFLARKQRSSIKAMIQRERKAGRLGKVQKGGRRKNAFQTGVGKKTLMLDLFPPKTEQVRAIPDRQDWKADLKPLAPMSWQSGRSLATRLEALDRAGGVCERCRERPVAQVHHTVPLMGKSFLARVMSDRDQRYTAKALCNECHLEEHGGSYSPRRRKSGRNAGYAERCSPSVGYAS